MKIVNMHEAKTNLSKLVAAAASGRGIHHRALRASRL